MGLLKAVCFQQLSKLQDDKYFGIAKEEIADELQYKLIRRLSELNHHERACHAAAYLDLLFYELSDTLLIVSGLLLDEFQFEKKKHIKEEHTAPAMSTISSSLWEHYSSLFPTLLERHSQAFADFAEEKESS